MDLPIGLNGKLILVTGASSGIGRATAIILSRLGARLILSGRRADALQETLEQTEGKGVHVCAPFDLMQLDAIPSWIGKLVADAGVPLDGAVHCAGVAGQVPLRAISARQIESTLAVNFHSSAMIIKGVSARNALPAAGSSVVLISSAAAGVASPGMSIYAASKAALLALARSAAKELAAKHVRVNCIAPAYVRTPMHAHAAEAIADFNRIEAQQFLGLIDPDEVAILAGYLLSDAAKRVTGSQFVIDGGFTL